MTAQLIEKNTTPLEKVPVDSVTLDIIENALKNTSERNEAKLNGSVTISFVFDRTNPGRTYHACDSTC